MKTKVYVLFFVLFCFSISLAQEVRSKDKKPEVKTTLSTKTLNATASTGDSVVFKDSDSNTLIKITDEGTTGSVTIPPGTAPSATANKLYNVGSKLYFNGSLLASSINDLSDAKTDSLSIFLGEGAGTNDEGNNSNVAIGKDVLFSNTSGAYNIGNGYNSLKYNTTGSYNTAIGYFASLYNSTGSNNTAIGYYTGPGFGYTDLTNTTCIGYGATVSVSNKIRLGNDAVTVIEGKVDFTFTSDSTKKENFLKVNGEDVLKKFRDFRLGSWNYKTDNPVTQRHYGIMAQEFFSAFGHDEMGTIGNDTSLTGSDVAGINMIAIQALEKRTTEQASEISSLENKVKELEKQNTELRNQDAAVESKYEEMDKRFSKIESLLNGQKFAKINN